MKDYLRERLEMVSIDQSTIDQYDERIANGELTERDVLRFVKLFELTDQESARAVLRGICENAEKIPANSEGWEDVRSRLLGTIIKNRDDQFDREKRLSELEEKYKEVNDICNEVSDIYNKMFPPVSIDAVRGMFVACGIPEEKFDDMRQNVLAPLEQDPPKHVDLDEVDKKCDDLGIGTKRQILEILTPKGGTFYADELKRLKSQMDGLNKEIHDEKNAIDNLAKQTDALSLMHSYARSRKTQLMAAEYLVTVAEPVREFLGRQHEHFKDMARDVSEYARDILDRTREIPKHIAYGSIAERIRLSDANFTPVIDATERHHAKTVSKAIRRYEESLRDREEFIKKRATREEERLRAQYRRDVEKWYRDASRGKPKEERDDLRQQKENLINARYSAIPEEARRAIEDSHKRILAKMDRVVDKHKESYERSLQKVAQDIVNIRSRAEKEREHLDSLLREGKISDKQYEKYIEQVDKIDYIEEQRFSKDMREFLDRENNPLGRTLLDQKIEDIIIEQEQEEPDVVVPEEAPEFVPEEELDPDLMQQFFEPEPDFNPGDADAQDHEEEHDVPLYVEPDWDALDQSDAFEEPEWS